MSDRCIYARNIYARNIYARNIYARNRIHSSHSYPPSWLEKALYDGHIY